MKYAYPAIFVPAENGEYHVEIPDLPGCATCGYNLEDALFMAKDAAEMWLWDAEINNETIPPATTPPQVQSPMFVNFVFADTDDYRLRNDLRPVRKMVTLPFSLNEQAKLSGIDLSATLQEALKQKLQIGN